MSLIKCPECGKQFSDKADSCPKCSCPISEIKKIDKKKQKEKPKKVKMQKPKITFKERIKNNLDSIKKSKKKQIILLSIILVIIVGVCIFLFLTVFNSDWKNAYNNYETAYKIAEKKNNDLENLISKAEKLAYSDDTALDEELRPTLETSISNAKSVLKDLPSKSLFIKKIKSKTDTLNKIDYSTEYNKLKNDYDNLDISIKKYKLVYKPTESYVIECLKTVKHVKNIAAVTEDNDPNGHLNKPGGYTATVYYSDDRINLDKDIYGKTVIEQGTDGGGAIEVYATVKDAEERRDYLSAYDGGIFANGSHTVVGTVLVRTSNELTASQQKEMEKMIIDALTYIDSSSDMVNEENNNDKKDTDNKKEDISNTQNSNNSSKPNNSSNSNTNTSKKSIEQVAKEIYNNKNKAISRTDLISILINEKQYSESDAKSVVENCCDWNSSTLILANNQSSSGDMYPKLIIDNLKAKQFTTDEINYAIKKCEHNWNELVVSHAKTLSSKYFSKKEITSQLNNLGFSGEQQSYALDNSNINWNTMASKYAEQYFYNKGYVFSYCKEHGGYIGDNGCPKCGAGTESSRYFSCSKEECISQFVSVGFTESQAKNALNNYDDNLFVSANNKKKHLAYYTLGRLLVYINPKPTRDECTNKLSNWGFSNEEINYAHSKYADYHFSK